MRPLDSALYLGLALSACQLETAPSTKHFKIPKDSGSSPEHWPDTGLYTQGDQGNEGEDTNNSDDSGSSMGDTSSPEEEEELILNADVCSALLGYEGDSMREQVDDIGLIYVSGEPDKIEGYLLRMRIDLNQEVEKTLACTEYCKTDAGIEQCQFLENTVVREGYFDFFVYMEYDYDPPDVFRTWITTPDRNPEEDGWLPTNEGKAYTTWLESE